MTDVVYLVVFQLIYDLTDCINRHASAYATGDLTVGRKPSKLTWYWCILSPKTVYQNIGVINRSVYCFWPNPLGRYWDLLSMKSHKDCRLLTLWMYWLSPHWVTGNQQFHVAVNRLLSRLSNGSGTIFDSVIAYGWFTDAGFIHCKCNYRKNSESVKTEIVSIYLYFTHLPILIVCPSDQHLNAQTPGPPVIHTYTVWSIHWIWVLWFTSKNTTAVVNQKYFTRINAWWLTVWWPLTNWFHFSNSLIPWAFQLAKGWDSRFWDC